MLEELRDLVMNINEEITYRDNVTKHKKSLETTLWGLEEQIRLPENASPQDQEEINIQINHCREKIMSCNKLLDSHKQKVIKNIDEYKLSDILVK